MGLAFSRTRATHERGACLIGKESFASASQVSRSIPLRRTKCTRNWQRTWKNRTSWAARLVGEKASPRGGPCWKRLLVLIVVGLLSSPFTRDRACSDRCSRLLFPDSHTSH